MRHRIHKHGPRYTTHRYQFCLHTLLHIWYNLCIFQPSRVKSMVPGRKTQKNNERRYLQSLLARFMGPTWGPSGADRTQVDPMLAPWTLLSGTYCANERLYHQRNHVCPGMPMYYETTQAVRDFWDQTLHVSLKKMGRKIYRVRECNFIEGEPIAWLDSVTIQKGTWQTHKAVWKAFISSINTGLHIALV